MAGGFLERHARGQHRRMVAGEVVGFKEEEHPPTRLMADGRLLLLAFGAGKHQPRATARGFDRDPALAALVDVIDQPEPQLADLECEPGLIIRHDERYGGQAGGHVRGGCRAG